MNPTLSRPPHVLGEQMERIQRDFETYRRELRRLLQEGHANRYALIKDDKVWSIWDTVGDALQAAGERFGIEPVATYKINPLDVERLTTLDAQAQPGKEAECPS
jgi:hypothetical protein